jgi:hypothetical protein
MKDVLSYKQTTHVKRGAAMDDSMNGHSTVIHRGGWSKWPPPWMPRFQMPKDVVAHLPHHVFQFSAARLVHHFEHEQDRDKSVRCIEAIGSR